MLEQNPMEQAFVNQNIGNQPMPGHQNQMEDNNHNRVGSTSAGRLQPQYCETPDSCKQLRVEACNVSDASIDGPGQRVAK